MSEQALGLVHSIYHRSTWTTGDYYYLQDPFVWEDARGGGIGRALVELDLCGCETSRVSHVHWLTHESNHNAMQLYGRIADRAGFIQYRKLFA